MEAIHYVTEKSKCVEKGKVRVPSKLFLLHWGFREGRKPSLNYLWLGRVEGLVLLMGTSRNGRNSKMRTAQPLFKCLQLGRGVLRVETKSPLGQIIPGCSSLYLCPGSCSGVGEAQRTWIRTGLEESRREWSGNTGCLGSQ